MNCIRITSENIDNLGITTEKNIKQDKGREWLIENEVDIGCWQEIGCNWSLFRRRDRLASRLNCKAWDNLRVSTSHNQNEKYNKYQPGGTATLTFGAITGTIQETGRDPTGLGRWSYTTYLGNKGKSTCVISAYNPCKTKITAPHTVYAQHSRYFLNQNIDTCPREMFTHDLSIFLTSLEQKHINVILCIDLNEDITRQNGPLYQKLIKTNKLINAMTTIHPKLDPPATNDQGSRPIDAILISASLQENIKTGWLPFGSGIGDHRIGFIDININTFIGKEKNEIASHKARKL